MTPNVISTKDFLYLKDVLSWNLQAYKKLRDIEMITIDKDVKKSVSATKSMHKKHYDEILNILKENK